MAAFWDMLSRTRARSYLFSISRLDFGDNLSRKPEKDILAADKRR
jgi:hypothetical protein